MQQTEFQLLTIYFREISVGLLCFFLISALHIKIITHLSFITEVKVIRDLKLQNYSGIIRINMALFLLLGVCHILSIGLWSLILFYSGLVPVFINALLFAGSCYTTLGYMGDTLPVGWRVVALFIALSGLFSFSLSTGVLISKTNNFRIAWKNRYKSKIMKYLKKHKLSEEDFEKL